MTHPTTPHQAHAAVQGSGTRYTCPMHPQISMDAPGICPKCGMALEPSFPSLDEDENPELVDFQRRFWRTLPATSIVLVLAMFGHRWTALEPELRTWVLTSTQY